MTFTPAFKLKYKRTQFKNWIFHDAAQRAASETFHGAADQLYCATDACSSDARMAVVSTGWVGIKQF